MESPEGAGVDVDALSSRVSGLKARDARANDQARRRKERLAIQAERRKDHLRFVRGLVCGVDASAGDGEVDAGADSVERMACDGAQRDKSVQNAHAQAFMLPEWMTDIPDDLGACWIAMIRPSGQRCLVTSMHGRTTTRRRNGSVMAQFQSVLPGGSAQSAASKLRCVIDCIFEPQARMYFVLDVLCWRGFMLHACPAEFRLYWALTKLAEVGAQTRAAGNPVPFVVVPFEKVTAEGLRRMYEEPPTIPCKKDGILFVHKDTIYEEGRTPLQLIWMDEKCSPRFFDYGSKEIRERIARTPDKAQDWKIEEKSTAVSIGELLAALSLDAHMKVGDDT